MGVINDKYEGTKSFEKDVIKINLIVVLTNSCHLYFIIDPKDVLRHSGGLQSIIS